MIAKIHKSEARGKFKNDWLDTRYSFSFADYFDREYLNFGALRVLNDDIVAPGMGFGMHPHDNMEIITIPLSGSLAHRDSLGHEGTIGVNEVQVMTAGTGIFHSEYNASKSEPVSLLQIWIYPKSRNLQPGYNQKMFDTVPAQNTWQLLASGTEGDGALKINQDAKLSRVFLGEGQRINYQMNTNSFGAFIFVIEGKVELDGKQISKRDSISISGHDRFEMLAIEPSYILTIEVPQK
jgi:quercetin 2,3-dioxygenase